MKIIRNYKSENEVYEILQRASIDFNESFESVSEILKDVKLNGDLAVLKYAKEFDGFKDSDIKISKEEIDTSGKKIDVKIKDAIDFAFENIYKFHKEQIPKEYSLETCKGVTCKRVFRPIENVGLYIPGGTAVLPSTMLMLGIPALLAGCKRVVVVSPNNKRELSDEILYIAKRCNIKEIYTVGGAHAVGMLAYGTEKVKKVDKIFGPGNQYVTAAKILVSNDVDGCSFDMPAGPSEIMIIADETANPKFVAADFLSQAEHGINSQSILLTTSAKLAELVIDQINKQMNSLSRKSYIEKSLKNSAIVICNNIDEILNYANYYAPEHLIISTSNYNEVEKEIVNAGSIFLGNYSPESAGDYCSGTNHSLPTYGWAKSFSGLSVNDFMKSITVQELTKEGLNNLSECIIQMASLENLDAHANAVKVRLEDEN